MGPGDVGDDHVQTRAVRQHGVHEGSGEVHPSPGALQHPFDEVSDAVGGQDRRGQLAAPVAGDEHPAGLVDPDFFHGRVVEVALQRPESGDRVVDEPGGGGAVDNRRQIAGERAFLVFAEDVLDELAYAGGFLNRVEGMAPDEFAHFTLDE